MSKTTKLGLAQNLSCPTIKHDDICTSLILTHFSVTPEANLSNSMEVTMKQVVLRLLKKKLFSDGLQQSLCENKACKCHDYDEITQYFVSSKASIIFYFFIWIFGLRNKDQHRPPPFSRLHFIQKLISTLCDLKYKQKGIYVVLKILQIQHGI